MIPPAVNAPARTAPIGVFDSGIGGLSVLQALQREMPQHRFVYLADNAHAPYGEKTPAFVRQRSLAIAQHLLQQHHIQALVVACNTATALAIADLRQHLPHLPLVGVEPAVKPAAQLTRTGRVAVMATQGTVASEKFQRLLSSLEGSSTHFQVCACNGLALAIERSVCAPLALPVHTTVAMPISALTSATTSATTPASTSAPTASPEVNTLLQHYLAQLGPFGTAPGHCDTLVLGCTHYVFARQALRELLGPQVQLVCTGEAVARHTRRLLHKPQQALPQQAPAQSSDPALADAPATLQLLSTGPTDGLQHAAQRWLHLPDCRVLQVRV